MSVDGITKPFTKKANTAPHRNLNTTLCQPCTDGDCHGCTAIAEALALHSGRRWPSRRAVCAHSCSLPPAERNT